MIHHKLKTLSWLIPTRNQINQVQPNTNKMSKKKPLTTEGLDFTFIFIFLHMYGCLHQYLQYFQLNPTNLAFYKCINKILQYYENKCKQYYVKMMHIMNSWCLSAGIILLSNKSGILLIFSDHETIPSVSSNIGEQEGPEHSHKI